MPDDYHIESATFESGGPVAKLKGEAILYFDMSPDCVIDEADLVITE